MLVHTPSLHNCFPSPLPLLPLPITLDGFAGWLRTADPYSLPIDHFSLLYRCSHPALAFGKHNPLPTEPAHPAIYYTAPPHSSTVLTIFYILYRPSLRILLLVSFDFELCKMWMLLSFTLYQCCLSFVHFPSLARLSAQDVLLVRFPVHSSHLSSFYAFPHPNPRFIARFTLIQIILVPVSPYLCSKSELEHTQVTIPSDFPRPRSIACQYLYHHRDSSSLWIHPVCALG